jgi:hypothetical protein
MVISPAPMSTTIKIIDNQEKTQKERKKKQDCHPNNEQTPH